MTEHLVHAGAHPCYSNRFYRTFANRWIGRGGTFPSQLRSLDLNPIELFFMT